MGKIGVITQKLSSRNYKKRPIATFMSWLLRMVNPSDQESQEWLRKIFQLDLDNLLSEKDRRRNEDLMVNSLLYTPLVSDMTAQGKRYEWVQLLTHGGNLRIYSGLCASRLCTLFCRYSGEIYTIRESAYRYIDVDTYKLLLEMIKSLDVPSPRATEFTIKC